MDLADWCQQNGLFTATARQLRHQGFVTAEDLRDVTDDDVRETFQKRGKLPLQQCVVLREALADFRLGKARRRRRKGVSIAEWSRTHDLDSETIKVLEKEGFTTADDMKYVTALDVKTTFQKRGALPLQQCIALRKALEENSCCPLLGGKDDSRCAVPAADRHNGQAHRTTVYPLSVAMRADHQSSPRTPTTHSRHSDEEGNDSISPRESGDDVRGEDITAFRSSRKDTAQRPGQFGNPMSKLQAHHQPGAEYRVVVAGTEHSGKTRTVQTILGQQDDTIHSLHGETARGRIHRGNLLGHSVQILDTSGWLDTNRSPSELATTISTDLQQFRPGAHAVLYTVDISRRFTKQQSLYYRQLQAVFSHNLPPYLILVFTHGDSLLISGKDIDDLLLEAPTALQELLKDCHGRYLLFDNKTLLQNTQAHELLYFLEKLKSQNLPKPCLSVDEGVADIARRLSEVGEDLIEQASFVQARRQQQKESKKESKESKKQRKNSRKALD